MTIPTTDALELDIAGVEAAYERRVGETCPEYLALALRLLDRLPPARWTLEWYLPWWLGGAFGLDPAVAREIVISNVLGLGSVRLEDDLADGDLEAGEVAPATVLSTALFRAALAPYRTLFEPSAPFWAQVDARMTAWRAATDGGGESRLAERGAPLKISAVAVCLLADRMDAWPALDRCLELALEAQVLIDHVADWEEDLDAGRWNAFVASISSGPQVEALRERHRRAVLVALLTSDALATQFAAVETRLLRAADIAGAPPLAVSRLAEHLWAFAARVNEEGVAYQAHYRELGDRTAKLLLPAPFDARS